MKRLLLILLFAALSLSASAQFGIKAGLLYNNFRGEPSDAYLTNKSRAGFQAGLLYKFQIPLLGLSVQPEILYSESRTDYTHKGPGGVIVDCHVKQRSLFVPINFQFGLDLVMLRPFVQVSPYMRYLLNEESVMADANYLLNRFNYGIGVGGGLDIWRFQVSATCYWDLKKAAHSTLGTGESFAKAKNRGVMISLAYFF